MDVEYDEVGDYDVFLTVTNSAGSDTRTEIGYISVFSTSVQELKLSSVQVFPNPTDGLLNLSFSHSENQQGKLMVSDVFGRQILEQKIVSRNYNSQLDLSQQSSGIYFLSIQIGDAVWTRKISLF